MKHGAPVIIMLALAFASGLHFPASAQSAIGGVKKQNALGGPVKQTSPVIPANKAAPVVPVNRAVPAVPVNKPAPAVVAASASAPSAHVKCVAPCGARGPR
jgi:hypothetical protein